MKKMKLDKNYFYIFIIAIIIMLPFFSYKYILGHDTVYHLSNIESITADWLSLNFSKISGGIINSLGYAGDIFYPKFPHFLAAFINIPFYIMGKSPVYAIKIAEFIIVLISGIFMYKLVNKIYKNEKTALISSTLYITSSYFITDIFVRNAYNETCLFMWIPIVFLGLEYLKENNKKLFIILFSLGYIGMINTHLVLSVYFTIFVILYILFNFKKYLTKKNIISFIEASLMILIVCMPSLILMIQHKNLNIYGVFSDGLVAKLDVVKWLSIDLKQFILPDYTGKTPYFLNHFLNVFEILGIVLSTIYLLINKNKKKNAIIYGILLLLAIFMSTKYFPYQLLPKLLLSIQFAYRCDIFVCFFGAIYATYCIELFKENMKANILKMAALISLISLFPLMNAVKYYDIGIIEWDKFAGLGAQHEYLTLNALETKKYKTKENEIEVLKGSDIKIEIIENKTPKLIAKIDNVTEKTTVELPRLYYLGYDIKFVNTSGKKYKLNYNLDKDGFIKVNIKESGTIYVKYIGTMLYNIFRMIRIIAIISIVITIMIKKKGLKKYEKR